ncbi:MAG: dihydrofolate reductase [Aeromonadales bacterium]|nr:dihydrofolate reductase [Aeromonadales bacterium]
MAADIQIIVALADNFVIGNKGQIPWHLSDDLKHFKEITTGYPVVMGRRTFESIGRVLPNRLNIMISNTFDNEVEGLVVLKSLSEAIDYVKDQTLMVIGGAAMYKEALPLASKLHLTRIKKSFEGDTKFPDFREYPFELVDSKTHFSEKCNFEYDFETWQRKK